MPNVTWQEPQVLVDLLALNLFAERNGLAIPGPKEIAVVSPWLSDIELFMPPNPWHQNAMVGTTEQGLTLQLALREFCKKGWVVNIAVLAYGSSPSGLEKKPEHHISEREFLRSIQAQGAKIRLVPDLHAKGIVTPFGIVTGSTNITTSGMYLQSQNTNYFPHDHPDYQVNREQLLKKFEGIKPTDMLP